MTSKTFTSGTVVDSPWLNDVNTSTYTSVPALQTKTANLPTVSAFAGTMMDDVDAAGVRTTISAAASGANSDLTSLTALVSVPTVVATSISANTAQIQSISAAANTPSASQLSVSSSALTLDFRSNTLTSGTVTRITGTPTNLVIPGGATLGTTSGQLSRIAVLAINYLGAIELAVVNVLGGNDLTETGLITTTAISGGSTAANVIYSTAARASVAYRVIGFIESTQATAGTWATSPSTIQGGGGLSLIPVALGQVWKSVSTYVIGTTYYNTSGRKKTVVQWGTANAASQYWVCTINGVAINSGSATPSASATFFSTTIEIPAGASFVFTAVGGTPASYQSWELS